MSVFLCALVGTLTLWTTVWFGQVAPSSDADLIYKVLNSSREAVFDSTVICQGVENTNCSLFLQVLWKKYAGEDGVLSPDELDTLLNNGRKSQLAQISPITNQTLCINNDDKHCMLFKSCFSAADIFQISDVKQEVTVNNFSSLLPAVVYALQQSECSYSNESSGSRPSHKPPVGQVWGFGFLSVTLINLCSLLGMVFIPFTKRPIYKKLLMFMVALGVGTLTGSSLLFLIPECFGLTHEDSPYKDVYIWKATVIIGGVYLFFLTERILQSIMDKRDEAAALHKDHVGSVKLKSRTRHDSSSMNMSFTLPESVSAGSTQNVPHLQLHHSATDESHISQRPLIEEPSGSGDKVVKTKVADKVQVPIEKGNGICLQNQSSESEKVIKSVAWMVIFGDGLHNFIDGLSIGAAFSENILAGISVSLAVICEELPHELGDFAILLNSGMTVKQALKYNFLSACMCYFGLAIGILIGEMTNGGTWIFAIAGGMFLYISLVDMLPEVNHAAQEEIKTNGKPVMVFLLQNSGLLTGYGLMLFLAIFAGKIDLEKT